MKVPRINQIHVYLVIFTFIVGRLVWTHFEDRMARLRLDQQQFLTDKKQKTWPKEDAERAIAVHQQVLEIERKRANEEVKALGGPLEASAKNPALDIRQMLEQMAIACAPQDAEISVLVDRFTEFEVAWVLHQPLSSTQLAELAKSFLKNNFSYVHGIRFIQGNELLAQMDETAIESVTNWNEVSIDSVESLLIQGNRQNPPTLKSIAENEANTAQATETDLSPEQIKIRVASKIFDKHFKERSDRLQKLVDELDKAADMNCFLNPEAFQSRIDWLGQFDSRLSAEREFFLNQPADMEHLLKDEGLNQLLISIIMRDIKARSQSEYPIFVTLFTAISGYREQIQIFLTGMKAHPGEWSVDLNSKTIEFTTTAAHEAYVSGSEKVTLSAGMVRRAFEAWSNYKPSK